jgi:hypothetical protein
MFGCTGALGVGGAYRLAMHLAAVNASLLASELLAKGFLAGIGKTILIIIVILVAIGALIGFRAGRRKR